MPRLKYYNNETNQWEYADNTTGIDLTNYATKEYVDNSKVTIDATLTVEGAAADAKAVGDAINQISGGNANQVDYVVQDTPPENTSVLWVDPTDNTDDGFQEAVNTALAQAKASGEFDGKDGQDYVLTDADKAEIAALVDVPGTGGNVDLTGYAKIEDIPTDEHINSLIDTKLAQFSNAEGVSF